jgi:hypothetical protein
MSLVADYRSFAATIVYRLQHGALGSYEDRTFAVLICVDELDKIVDFEEIRVFVRRIKAIFEVPGVYYYISLAEDTLTKLYFGPAEGKNEIDSAFDHIVRIPPVSCDISEDIAANYLEAGGLVLRPPRLARAIGTLSFGIPRDIVRRCDEYLARDAYTSTGPKEVALDLRRSQSQMGYELGQLTATELAEISANAQLSAQNARTILTDGVNGEVRRRLVLSIWVVALVELSLDLPDVAWITISQTLCELGYDIPIAHVGDLIDRVEKIHANVTGATDILI